jgi:hypothetical protein
MKDKFQAVLSAIVAAILLGASAYLSFFDQGLRFAEIQLANDPFLSQAIGSPLRLRAYRARWAENEHVYGVIVLGKHDWVFERVRVEYVDGKPKKAKFIGN